MGHTLTRADLVQFTGTGHWYRHGLDRRFLYTDGVQHVAEAGGAYWLLDEIVLAQHHVPAVSAERFQTWRLTVRPDHTARLECGDGNGGTVFSKEIAYTDFPLVCLELYLTNSTILLPGEY